MSKIFGILTLIILAIAAFVGLKNKAAYQTEITSRQEVEAKLKTGQTKLETAQSDLAATQKDNDAAKAEIPLAKAREAEQKKINDELNATKTSKAQEVEGNKTKLDQFREKTASLGNIKDLAAKMGTISVELKDLDVAIGASESKLASLTTENNRLDAAVGEQRKQVELRSKGESFSTLKTHISAVYPNWGFVTLAAGNNAGVITNSTLDVIRNDEVIAKLLVTAVERNTSSASIIPESVQADTTLSAGDRVVPGAKLDTGAKKSASPATTPAPAN